MKAEDEEGKQAYITIRRIPQEEIICEGEKREQLLQSVVCPVCLMLLPMPHYSCESCDNAFCTECLQDWWRKNPNACIFKCSDPTFKLIKRSNTYNALMEILKTTCKHCATTVPIVFLDSHDKTCPKKPISCLIEGCGRVLAREQMEQHTKTCEFQKVACKYCKESFSLKDIEAHEDTACDARESICQYKLCGALIKFKEAEQHSQTCLFRPQTCEWCQQALLRKDKSPHQRNCIKREIKCEWCSNSFKANQFQQHLTLCEYRKIVCQLCEKQVNLITVKEHKIDCMYLQMLEMKQAQKQLMQQNVRLKEKVHYLQNQLDDMVRHSQEGALEAMMRVKEQQRRQFEKDLQRLNNGIANIQKLRNAEMTQHLKKPHLSSSLCPFCIAIRNKLDQDLAPLMRQKEEVNQKIIEVDRLHSATLTSKVKISKIK